MVSSTVSVLRFQTRGNEKQTLYISEKFYHIIISKVLSEEYPSLIMRSIAQLVE